MSPPNHHDPITMRHADPAALEAGLCDSRAVLLRLFEAWRAELPATLEIRYAPELNPPLWELGHVAWFEEFWLGRNPQRLLGPRANPDVTRAAPWLRGADALYNSSQVAHASRWQLDMPDASRTLAMMAGTRQRSLALLREADADDDALYFFRLALCHEDMHCEAWIYMAQHLALDIRTALAADRPAVSTAAGDWSLPGGAVQIGSEDKGFAFDNERVGESVDLAPYAIDRAPLNWQSYLPFIDAGGYDDQRLWTAAGWAWRQTHDVRRPQYLRCEDGVLSQVHFGQWGDLDLTAPAMHVTQHEAQAWCRWAGRRLPTEAEWENAAVTAGQTGEVFDWGQVWEWTASPFAPYAGFEPHPYRDYSMPWFDGRPVLRGASFATADRMKHPRYRNYFSADRGDLFAGFRTCAAT